MVFKGVCTHHNTQYGVMYVLSHAPTFINISKHCTDTRPPAITAAIHTGCCFATPHPCAMVVRAACVWLGGARGLVNAWEEHVLTMLTMSEKHHAHTKIYQNVVYIHIHHQSYTTKNNKCNTMQQIIHTIQYNTIQYIPSPAQGTSHTHHTP